MSDVTISRRGGGGSSNGKQLITEIITSNMNWTVPRVVNNEISVRIFGAGGGGEFSKGSSWWRRWRMDEQ